MRLVNELKKNAASRSRAEERYPDRSGVCAEAAFHGGLALPIGVERSKGRVLRGEAPTAIDRRTARLDEVLEAMLAAELQQIPRALDVHPGQQRRRGGQVVHRRDVHDGAGEMPSQEPIHGDAVRYVHSIEGYAWRQSECG